ncbi:MAG: sorbosone dehydrogenase family protein [Alphaproteobacteria bacterium]|nr:sorbosone dehydrogenase family protein [Alphaproteobacteria bacterium]
MRSIVLVLAALPLLLDTASAVEPPKPGQRYQVTPVDLPRPYATQSASNPSQTARLPQGHTLSLPEGFRSNIFAQGLGHARNLVVAPDGTVFLAQPARGEVTLLRDRDGDGVAEVVRPFLTGLDRPHGLAVYDGRLYVADMSAVRRVKISAADRPESAPEVLTQPGALGPATGHWTRNLAIGRDGSLYVAIGSASNIGIDPEPRASVQIFGPDGSNRRTFASGLRNPVGITFRPGTDELYVVVNERDGLGDGLVPDYLTRLTSGAFFGWPYSYIGKNPQPGFAERAPEKVAAAQVPDLLFHAHSAPLGVAFYDGKQFPEAYRGDAFVTLHGSWNAAEPRGYMVARVPFRDGKPQGYYEAFASGFWTGGTNTARVVGRPVGIVVAADGALLVADDEANVIWRVSYGR